MGAASGRVPYRSACDPASGSAQTAGRAPSIPKGAAKRSAAQMIWRPVLAGLTRLHRYNPAAPATPG